MPYREKDCLRLYVTEFFFFWKILVTYRIEKEWTEDLSEALTESENNNDNNKIMSFSEH